MKTPPFVYQAVRYHRGRLSLIDQTRLPGRLVWLRIRSAAEGADAIRRLAVRGAPNIGVAAAYSLAVEARRLGDREFEPRMIDAAGELISARPTAVNLDWAVRRMLPHIATDRSPSQVRRLVEEEAVRIEGEEIERSLAIARAGLKLLRDDSAVMTICNTGSLAGPGLGTALGIVLHVRAQGRRVRVIACETRPLLQGARLTMLELKRAGVPARLIADSAAATFMPDCDLVLAGADRIARNGDTANKVGTLMLAILAQEFGKPFYVAAPGSTFDHKMKTGKKILVEKRDPREVTSFGSCRVAPEGAIAINPAFDVTPARFITGFVTEKGILRPPFRRSIARLPREKQP